MKSMVFLAMVGIGLFAIACDNGSDSNTGIDDEKDSDNGDAAKWLTRMTRPESDYKPMELETTINDIVAELNKSKKNTQMKLSFIPKDLEGYFETAVLGANHAFRELSVVGNVVAPTADNDVDEAIRQQQQIDLVSTQTENGSNGIGIAPFNDELIPVIDAAVKAGAFVVTFDGDIPASNRHLYAGTLNAEAGRTAGETMVSLLEDETGTVIILGNDDPVWVDGYDRTYNAKEIIEDAGNTVVIRHTTWGDQESDGIFIKETIETATLPVVGCLGVFSNSHYCAFGADAAGASDSVKVAAFDFEPQTVEYMEAGKIQVTHVQRQYYMGYLVPYLLYAANALGIEKTKSLVSDLMVDDEKIDLGLDLIFADKVDAYNTFLDELGVL